MMDNEHWGQGGELDKAIKKLGAAWKQILKKGNEELGLDAEFSRHFLLRSTHFDCLLTLGSLGDRPAVESFLTKFATSIAEVDSIEQKFVWA